MEHALDVVFPLSGCWLMARGSCVMPGGCWVLLISAGDPIGMVALAALLATSVLPVRAVAVDAACSGLACSAMTAAAAHTAHAVRIQ